jgi:hypothetical protein
MTRRPCFRELSRKRLEWTCFLSDLATLSHPHHILTTKPTRKINAFRNIYSTILFQVGSLHARAQRTYYLTKQIKRGSSPLVPLSLEFLQLVL